MAKVKSNPLNLTRCVKLRIVGLKNEKRDAELKKFWKMLNQQSDWAREIANETVRIAYLAANKMPVPYEKANDGYHYFVEKYPEMTPGNVNQTFRWANRQFSNHKKEIMRGNESLINFKKGTPIVLNNNSTFKVIEDKGSFYIDAALRPKKKDEDGNVIQYRWVMEVANLRHDRSGKELMHRIAAEEIHHGAGQIKKDPNKNKWYFILPYEIPREETINGNLDKSKIMGIDLGIQKAAYFAFNCSLDRGYIDGHEIDEFRRRTEAKAKQKKRQYKWSSRQGHGI